jgi:hypothetical protein
MVGSSPDCRGHFFAYLAYHDEKEREVNAILTIADATNHVATYGAVILIGLAIAISDILDNYQYWIGYVMLAGFLLTVMYLMKRYQYAHIRLLNWYWLRKIGEVMPSGTKDDHATSTIADACLEAVFNLAVEKKISWRAEKRAYNLLALLFDSDNLRPVKFHRKAIRAKVLKNIAAMKAGPAAPIPGKPEPQGLKFLKNRREAA